LDVDVQRVDIWGDHGPGARWRCPVCDRTLGCYGHARERVGRHLDTCQYPAHLDRWDGDPREVGFTFGIDAMPQLSAPVLRFGIESAGSNRVQ